VNEPRHRVLIEPFPGGFRRLWPGVPLRLPGGRDTSLVREVLSSGGTRLEKAAETFETWEHLMALAETGWLGPPRASARTSLVESRERLCAIAGCVRALADLRQSAPGDVVYLRGRVRAAETQPRGQSVVWTWRNNVYDIEQFFAAEDPWPLPDELGCVETAYDFRVEGEEGEGSVLVHVDGGHLVAAGRLEIGARINVLGYFDRVVDPTARRQEPRSPPLRPILRSGQHLPLLVLSA
jgi:hypothetical protein